MKHLLTVTIALLLLSCDRYTHVFWLVSDSRGAESLEEINNLFTGRDHADLVIPIASARGSSVCRDTEWFFATRIMEGMEANIQNDGLLVVLGTNDLDFADDPTFEGFAGCIDRFLGAMPNVPVVWEIPNAYGHGEEHRAQFETALRDAESRWPNLNVFVLDPTALLEDDGIHYNPEGEQALALALDEEIHKHVD